MLNSACLLHPITLHFSSANALTSYNQEPSPLLQLILGALDKPLLSQLSHPRPFPLSGPTPTLSAAHLAAPFTINNLAAIPAAPMPLLLAGVSALSFFYFHVFLLPGSALPLSMRPSATLVNLHT